jgi:hypothetical protein
MLLIWASLKGAGSGGPVWILALGVWNDEGEWIDDSVWID